MADEANEVADDAPVTPLGGAFPAPKDDPFSSGTLPETLGTGSETQSESPPDETPDETPDAADDTKVAAESPDESTEDSDDSGFSSDLLEMAKSAGYDEARAKGFGTPDNLEQFLAELDKQAAAFGRSKLEQPSENGQATNGQSTNGQDTNGKPPEQTSQQLGQYEKFKIDLDPDEYDEKTVETLNKMNDHYDSVIRQHDQLTRLTAEALMEIASDVQKQTGQSKAEDTAHVEQDMDSFFEGLGEPYADLFGKGATRSLPSHSPSYQNRVNLYEEMRALEVADAYQHRQSGSRKQYQQRALNSLFWDQVQSTARKQISNTVKQRRGQAIARPASRPKKPLNPDDAALANISEKMRAAGMIE